MKLILVFSSLLLINSHLFAHGGNKPGPHGGKIKMPGMFHTELILNAPNDFKVYLLDMKFKNPETDPFYLVYASPSFYSQEPGPMSTVLIYKINHDYNS